ncbi:alpha/beta hydrolase [Sphingobium sp.]|uniref:alpha/beta fold hydrolase n=1 Tax=Sphingobium sp. TaxID=1912891 RepID=UPI0028BE253C|nr:alpha/beta hydrolase [Sphingobium sp.]
MAEPRSRFIAVAGTRRHMLIWGDPSAPPLLLVHGLLDHAHNWDWIAAALADRFHIMAPDLRGHGDSDWTGPASYSLANHVMDLADIVHALDLRDIRLVGHSLGGQLALRLAATYADRVQSLFIIEGVELPIVRDQREAAQPYPARLRQWIEGERQNRQRSPRTYASFAEAQARMAGHNPGIDADTIAHLTRHGVVALADGGWRWKYDDACRQRAPEDAHGIELDEILSAIACPTLLAYGERSWIPVPPSDRLARIRDHRLIHFPDVGHWLHHQSRDAFLAVLTDFLKTNERRSHA